MINVDNKWAARDSALLATAQTVDPWVDKGHTGKILVEYNLLNGSILSTDAEIKTRIFTAEKRK